MSRPIVTRADTQRARVLAVSAEIFSRRGFRATSMNEIAAAVGLSKPTLYHYFRSKEELLVRLYSDMIDESLAAARETLFGSDGEEPPSPFDALRDLIASRVAYTCRNQALLKVCFEEEHELPPELGARLLEKRRSFDDLFADVLQRHLAQYPGQLGDVAPRVYANVCLGAANWTYQWYRADGPLDPEELGRQVASVLMLALDPAVKRSELAAG